MKYDIEDTISLYKLPKSEDNMGSEYLKFYLSFKINK